MSRKKGSILWVILEQHLACIGIVLRSGDMFQDD